jgi:hypothetical protein
MSVAVNQLTELATKVAATEASSERVSALLRELASSMELHKVVAVVEAAASHLNDSLKAVRADLAASTKRLDELLGKGMVAKLLASEMKAAVKEIGNELASHSRGAASC